MKCPDTGILQMYIDGELDIVLRKELESHLLTCQRCRSSVTGLKENDDFVFEKIKAYKQYNDVNVDTVFKPANLPLPEDSNEAVRKGVSYYMIKYKKLAAAACAVLVITSCVAIQPVRAAISSALSIFRVENVKGINITLADIREIQDKLSSKAPEINLDKIGRIKSTGGLQKQITLKEAKNITDFPVLFPSALSAQKPDISSIDSATMEFTLNVENMNEILKTFNAKRLLPEGIDGKTFNIGLSRTVTLHYSANGKTYNFIQTKSPSIEVPEGVNVDELRDCLVEFPLLPENLKTQIKSITDWKSTLYVPVVDGISESVDINGSQGYVALPPSDVQVNEKVNSSIVWYDKGTIYSIIGNMSKDEIIGLARSMR